MTVRRPNLTAMADAVIALKEFYRTSGRQDLLSNAVISASTSIDVRSELLSLLTDTIEGGVFANEMIRKMSDFSSGNPETDSSLGTLLTIYYDLLDSAKSFIGKNSLSEILGASVNESPSAPSKVATTISLIQSHDVRVSPANHNSDAVALLLTAIPTIEYSKCVPYLDVQVITPRISTDHPSNLSLYKFLGGSYRSAGIESDLISSVHTDTIGDNLLDPVTMSTQGIEIFTSTQTMISSDESSILGVRSVPIIDSMRPLMSLKTFQVTLSPTTALNSGKFAKLSIVLHDRSRLGDISDLIRPDLYSKTDLLIEYGWSHPDGGANSKNVYGQILDSSRVREKYMIANSSFEFDKSGQVNIVLELSMKGLTDVYSTRIGDDQSSTGIMHEIRRVTEMISIMNRDNPNWDGIEDVRPTVIIDTASDITATLAAGTDLKKKIGEFIGSAGRETQNVRPELTSLVETLRLLFGEDGMGGAAAQANQTISSVVDEKMKSLRSGIDPILNGNNGEEYSTEKYVSLGKILLQFLSRPLSATGRFDEVQLIFYTFNSHAGKIHGRNISQFPIKINAFREEFETFKRDRATTAICLLDFTSWIANTFLNDQSNPSYGMSLLYETANADNKVNLGFTNDVVQDSTAIDDKITRIMKSLGIDDGRFSLPQVEMYTECIPSRSNPAASILRIHVHDRISSSTESISELLKIQKNDASTLFTAIATGDSHSEVWAQTISDAVAAGVIKRVDGDDSASQSVYIPAAVQAKVKEFVSSRVPTIRYGSNATGVISANLRSMQNAALSTVNMQRSNLGTGFSVQGADGNLIPMLMQPTELDIETLGCPMLSFGQFFFVDFDTGTTVDNMYGVCGITHEISSGGKFKTSVKMLNYDAYGEFRTIAGAIKAATAKSTAGQ